MDHVFLVLADRGGNSVGGEMVIAAYSNQQAAEDHAEYIDNAYNQFTARITFMPLYSRFLHEHDVGMKEIKYFEG